jgi:two-component system, OmpR family, sensor histidine kinase MprB
VTARRRLTLRGRLAVLTALAVTVAVAGCAAVSWFATRAQLARQLDQILVASGAGNPQDLDRALQECTREPGSRRPVGNTTIQVMRPDGTPCAVQGPSMLRVTEADLEVVRGHRQLVLRDGTTVAGIPVRILTRRQGPPRGEAGNEHVVSLALPLSQIADPLRTLAVLLLLVSAVGVVGAAAAGLVVARASLRPVDELTGAAEHIARTGDLDTRIPDRGADEVSRLSRAFNTMTAALSASRERQQQLIADAGHELRTPLTSLRTNVDLLMRSEDQGRDLPVEARGKVLASIRAQLRELTSLVDDLLELARPARIEPADETVALHEVVTRAADRARLRGPHLHIDTSLEEPWFVRGDPESLERAVVNLLDNAVKFSRPGGVVQVSLAGGELMVRDEGAGISTDDLPHVFERFWRSPSARGLPGAGLGLSIVSRIVRENGGQVRLEPAERGGTVARVRLPGSTTDR